MIKSSDPSFSYFWFFTRKRTLEEGHGGGV